MLVEGVEGSARTEGAAYALHDHQEATLGEQPAIGRAKDPAPPIGAADQKQGWLLDAARRVAICQQDHAVWHGYLQIALDQHMIGFGWRQVSHSGQETAEERHRRVPFLLVRTRPFALGGFDPFRQVRREREKGGFACQGLAQDGHPLDTGSQFLFRKSGQALSERICESRMPKHLLALWREMHECSPHAPS